MFQSGASRLLLRLRLRQRSSTPICAMLNGLSVAVQVARACARGASALTWSGASRMFAAHQRRQLPWYADQRERVVLQPVLTRVVLCVATLRFKWHVTTSACCSMSRGAGYRRPCVPSSRTSTSSRPAWALAMMPRSCERTSAWSLVVSYPLLVRLFGCGRRHVRAACDPQVACR